MKFRGKNMTGLKFGRLKVLECLGPNERKENEWRCLCDCGNEKITVGSFLREGRTQSCGCLQVESRFGKRPKTWEQNYENFKRSININEDTGCWLWNRGKDKNGYGQFKKNGQNRAHRWSFVFHKKKEIPDKMFVCHTCDDPSCVNPDHLFLGTAKDNSEDMVKKNRQYKGDSRWLVILAKNLSNKGLSFKEVAEELDITERKAGKLINQITHNGIEL